MSSFEDLIVEQRLIAGQIRRVVPNYRKLGKDKFTVEKTSTRITSLSDWWQRSMAIHVKLHQTAREEQLKHDYFKTSEFLTIEREYEEAIDILNDFLAQQEKARRSESLPQVTNTTTLGETSSVFKLPPITIPTFDGETTKWESFRDSFKALVGENTSLSLSQKLYYLKSFLKGNPKLMLEHISISDVNYEGAWKLLGDEYDNPRALVLAHIHAFAGLPAMKIENEAELKQLRDIVNSSLAALHNLKRPVQYWDDLLVYLISQKFSTRTHNEWNKSLGASNEFPTFKRLTDFLTERIRGIASPVTLNQTKSKPKAAVNNAASYQCPDCSGPHALGFCQMWLKKPIDDRFTFAKNHKLCFNCLKAGHLPNKCPSSSKCKKCQRPHHTTLHRASLTSPAANVAWQAERVIGGTNNTESVFPAASSSASHSAVSAQGKHPLDRANTTISEHSATPVLLATAWIKLRTPENRVVKTRALIDQGSSHSFITEALAQSLRTTRRRAALDITAFGNGYSGRATSYVDLALETCFGKSAPLKMTAYIFKRLTDYSATASRDTLSWPHLQGLTLADPDPSSRKPINVLIGADIYGRLLVGPLKKGPIGSPTAQLTTLGWIISGPLASARCSRISQASTLHCSIAPKTDVLIQKFWEIEEVPSKKFFTPAEEECETHFAHTHTRDVTGRYVVRLPFRNGSHPEIGHSHQVALKRYAQNEQRFEKTPELARAYSQFLEEYRSMGHMEKVNSPDMIDHPIYGPHHPVIRDSSATTRVRVVFNASSKTSNGTSLNDHLHIGPKLQREIGHVITNWRRYRFVYMTDIEKMFRQILIDRADADYQRIVWRTKQEGPIEKYRLLTVTYGTACAPYLANRVLRQLADDEGASFPDAAEVIRFSTYVDDILFGADDHENAIAMREQLVALCKRGGFNLRKWATNDCALVADMSAVGHDLAIDLSKEEPATLKVLGITWVPKEDAFSFQVGEIPKAQNTKRSVLSLIARLFDPLGWVAPVVIQAKIIMQDLWLAKIDWDEQVPQSIHAIWEKYCRELPKLSQLKIPRWISLSHSHKVIELHGFADASQRAYAAVIYLRVLNSPTDISVSLIVAKTKVAPLKTVAIPRLELNGVVLLVRLLESVKEIFKNSEITVYGWSDSTVALAWLTQHPSRWKPYVANRVSEIQTKMPEIKWNHVPTCDNPADCASRGISADELANHPLWWSGPKWLSQNSAFWPTARPRAAAKDVYRTSIFGEERTNATMHVAQEEKSWDLSLRFSSWGKLLRVTALLFRWLRKFRARSDKNPITTTESRDCVQEAREFWIRQIQELRFSSDIRALQSNAALPRSSALKSLNPFLDGKSQLRLGGRLRHSFLSYDERFPLILPRHHVSNLIVEQTHLRALHGGSQLTLRLLRQNYWILGARSLVKIIINRCLNCVRERAITARQLMGDLPSPRVNPSAIFSHCGVDYAGPFQIIPYVGRGQKARKYYVALFICLATRAIHLEYVDDYATSGFLAAFKRLVSRRGLPSDVYSDNGTNFQGADNELRRAFINSIKNAQLHANYATDGIRWHFIPASAPHFGGLWEAGVKSFKSHMKRVVGSHTLSQIEFATLLCQIEACLNSRPLTPLRDDPESFEALTPGHFLIGRPLLSVPEPSLLDLNENRLSRWQKVQAMGEHIWRAWTRDYLHTLHQRKKWQRTSSSLKIGAVVLLKNELLPPARWELARIIETHPGSDGHVRVVTLKTAKTTFKRPISKVCPLPDDTSYRLA